MRSTIDLVSADKPHDTRYLKRTLQVLAAGLLLVAGAVSGAETAPDALVKSTVDEVLTVIKQNKDKNALREIAQQKVVPHFDFKRMTQSAVGRAWRDATPAQQQALENGFRTLLVNTYTNALTTAATGSESVDVKPVKVGAGESE